MSRICMGKPLLTRISPTGPSGAVDLTSGRRTALACNAYRSSTLHRSTGRSSRTGVGSQ